MRAGSLSTHLIILIVALSCTAAAFPFLNKDRATSSTEQQPLYLPSGAGLEFITFGYKNALAGALWLDTVSYFGKHYTSDKDFRWLNHMCDLVTRLNPKVYEPYYFCSTMLAWEIETPAAKRQAISFLTNAMAAHPTDWFFPYLRGFYTMYFFHDRATARKDFELSASLPDAHPIAARLAAESLVDLESPESAIRFLQGMLKAAKDPHQRAALEDKIEELKKEIEGKIP